MYALDTDQPDLVVRTFAVRDVFALDELAQENYAHLHDTPGSAAFPISLTDLITWMLNPLVYSFGIWMHETLVGVASLQLESSASRATIAYWVGSPYLRRGYAYAASRMLLSLAERELGCDTVLAYT